LTSLATPSASPSPPTVIRRSRRNRRDSRSPCLLHGLVR
jgi:hypothetical protein